MGEVLHLTCLMKQCCSFDCGVAGGQSRGRCYQIILLSYHLTAYGKSYAVARQACGPLHTLKSAQSPLSSVAKRVGSPPPSEEGVETQLLQGFQAHILSGFIS